MTDPKAADSLSFAARTLSHRKPTRFDWKPGKATRDAMAQSLDLRAIKELRLKGEFRPEGRSDFRLVADLTADVVQSCIVTLEPVPAKIAETFNRRYDSDWKEPEVDEIELTEEDIEALPEVINIAEVAREALALALPEYPRAAGAALGEAVYSAEGTEALRDEDLRPFAGLAGLLKAQNDGGEDSSALDAEGKKGDLPPRDTDDTK